MKVYNPDKNVYQAARERIAYIFEKFPRIYVSFSGGKDSGVMLNLVLDYMRENGIKEKIGLMILDNEANFEYSLKFMRKIINANLDLLDVYWCCLPITLPCTVSSFDVDWQCWGEADKEKWVHPMPDEDYIVNIDNHPFPFFRENMNYDEFWDEFGAWYAGGQDCACMIGIRTDESLNRYRAIVEERKGMRDGHLWTKQNSEHVWNCYPIYDWTTPDVWVANAKNDWDYNELYDIFYRAGLTVAQMRVASPFMSESKSSLALYRVIDPHVWARLCSRVNGANFVATYGKQFGYRSIKLPAGHTWKSFVKFLLKTLPPVAGSNFTKRFAQSLKYWARVGRGVKEEVIADLEKHGVEHEINGTTPHGNGTLRRVRIRRPPDHLDMLRVHPGTVTSWKRFAITILKNDHTCKYLGLAPTREQADRQREITKKYKNLPLAK